MTLVVYSEQERGLYDWNLLQAEAEISPIMNHKTFVGPIERIPSSPSSVGLYTTRAVLAGDLLLCEKAFAYASSGSGEGWLTEYAGDASSSMRRISPSGYEVRRLATSNVGLLFAAVLRMMEFHTKYAFMSTGAVRRLLDERSAPQNKDLPDAEYMIPVVSMYAVNCPRTSRQWHPRDPTQIGVQHDFYGLWLEASQIKHSCISNANRSFIGDMQIIRASCNMPAGTQLAIWYQTPTDNYGEMLNGFAKWQLVCRCAYCVDLQTAPQAVIDERHRLIEKLGNMADENPLYPDDIEESVHLIQGTWYIHPWHVPRPTLVPIFVMLSRKYLDMCIPDRARSMCYRALESLGFAFSVYQGPPYAIVTINRWGLMTHDALDAFTHLCDIHVFSGAPHLAVQARDHAKLAYKIWIGEDATFDGYMEQASRYRHGFQALMP